MKQSFGEMKIITKATIKSLFIIFLISMLSCSFLLLSSLYLFELIENKTYDIRTQIFNSHKKGNDDIVLILIDSESINSLKPILGAWPWPRSIYKHILGFLKSKGVKTVIFDMLFSGVELDNIINPEYKIENTLLFQGIRDMDTVFLGMFIFDDVEEKVLHLPNDFSRKFSINSILKLNKFRKINSPKSSFEIPFKDLYNVSLGVGVLNIDPDRDGIFRRIPFIKRYDDNIFPMMPFAFLIESKNISSIEEKKNEYLFKNKKGDIYLLPKNETGQYLINFYKQFNTISFKDIFQSDINSNKFTELQNKIVLIGTSAPELMDFGDTAIGSLPGIMMHASAISNILNKDFLRTMNKKQTLLNMLFVNSIICSIVCFLKSNKKKIIISSIFYLLIIFVWIFLFKFNLVFKIVIPSLSVLATFCISFYLYNEKNTGQQEKRMKQENRGYRPLKLKI